MFIEDENGDLVDEGIFTMLTGNTYFWSDDGEWIGSAVFIFQIPCAIPAPVDGIIHFAVLLTTGQIRLKVEIEENQLSIRVPLCHMIELQNNLILSCRSNHCDANIHLAVGISSGWRAFKMTSATSTQG